MIRDLKPFVCLAQKCSATMQPFENADEWCDHHRWQHNLSWWCEGDQNHGPERFSSSDVFQSHLRRKHEDRSSEEDLSRLSRLAARPSADPFLVCPFCDEYEPGVKRLKSLTDNSEITSPNSPLGSQQNELQEHIKSHLLSMFLLALPWDDDQRDTKSSTNNAQADRSMVADLRDVSLEFDDESTFDTSSIVDTTVHETNNNDDWDVVRRLGAMQHLSLDNDPKLAPFRSRQSRDAGSMPATITRESSPTSPAPQNPDPTIMLLVASETIQCIETASIIGKTYREARERDWSTTQDYAEMFQTPSQNAVSLEEVLNNLSLVTDSSTNRSRVVAISKECAGLMTAILSGRWTLKFGSAMSIPQKSKFSHRGIKKRKSHSDNCIYHCTNVWFSCPVAKSHWRRATAAHNEPGTEQRIEVGRIIRLSLRINHANCARASAIQHLTRHANNDVSVQIFGMKAKTCDKDLRRRQATKFAELRHPKRFFPTKSRLIQATRKKQAAKRG